MENREYKDAGVFELLLAILFIVLYSMGVWLIMLAIFEIAVWLWNGFKSLFGCKLNEKKSENVRFSP